MQFGHRCAGHSSQSDELRYRIAFAADLGAGSVAYYVNGNAVFTGSAPLDGRHSLYSNLDDGPDLLLFNEGDFSGDYTHEFYLSSFFSPTARCRTRKSSR